METHIKPTSHNRLIRTIFKTTKQQGGSYTGRLDRALKKGQGPRDCTMHNGEYNLQSVGPGLQNQLTWIGILNLARDESVQSTLTVREASVDTKVLPAILSQQILKYVLHMSKFVKQSSGCTIWISATCTIWNGKLLSYILSYLKWDGNYQQNPLFRTVLSTFSLVLYPRGPKPLRHSNDFVRV